MLDEITVEKGHGVDDNGSNRKIGNEGVIRKENEIRVGKGGGGAGFKANGKAVMLQCIN